MVGGFVVGGVFLPLGFARAILGRTARSSSRAVGSSASSAFLIVMCEEQKIVVAFVKRVWGRGSRISRVEEGKR